MKEPIKRALIVKPPYAQMIVDGRKTLEMRSRKTNIRGRIGIIEQGTGTIIGEVDLVESYDSWDQQSLFLAKDLHRVEDLTLLKKWCFPWVLSNPEKYKEPKPYTHPKGAMSWIKL